MAKLIDKCRINWVKLFGTVWCFDYWWKFIIIFAGKKSCSTSHKFIKSVFFLFIKDSNRRLQRKLQFFSCNTSSYHALLLENRKTNIKKPREIQLNCNTDFPLSTIWFLLSLFPNNCLPLFVVMFAVLFNQVLSS